MKHETCYGNMSMILWKHENMKTWKHEACEWNHAGKHGEHEAWEGNMKHREHDL
jgi:hypothetical protein